MRSVAAWVASGALRGVCASLLDACDPVVRPPGRPQTVLQAHGGRGVVRPREHGTRVVTGRPRSSRIDKPPGCGPQAHTELHVPATGWTGGDAWGGGCDAGGLGSTEVARPAHQPEGGRCESAAGVHEAEGPDLHTAVGEDLREEPTEKLHSLEARGASTRPAGCAGGAGNGPVRQRAETAVGASDPEASRGTGCAGRVAVLLGLSVAVPGDGPAVWVARLQESGVAHVFFKDGAVDG